MGGGFGEALSAAVAAILGVMSAHIQPVKAVMVERLPGYEGAVIPREKLRGYVLNPKSDRGQHKARLFAKELGLEQGDWRYLKVQIGEGLPESEAVLIDPDHKGYGQEWEVAVLVLGRNRCVRYVSTKWLVPAKGPTRFITAWPERSQRNRELQALGPLAVGTPSFLAERGSGF